MKHIFSIILGFYLLVPVSFSYAAGGIGFQGGQSFASIGLLSTSLEGATLNTSKISNPLSAGLYIYIDALPIIDLEADISLSTKNYTFNFSNVDTNGIDHPPIGPYKFAWGDYSVYFTAGKKIIGLGIPFLAKAKLFYGAGINMHTVTPLMNLELMKNANGDLFKDPTDLSEDDLLNFLKDNKVKSNGFHIQSGLQIKVLTLDTFIFYRHTFSKNIYTDNESFGSVNIRFGYGL